MATQFGMAQDPAILDCAICQKPIPHTEKFTIERENIHKDCFKCGLCGSKLQVGFCAQELSLYNRYGPRWYCSLICSQQSQSVKEAKLKENGVQVRQPKKKN